jgi:hypothetical protein
VRVNAIAAVNEHSSVKEVMRLDWMSRNDKNKLVREFANAHLRNPAQNAWYWRWAAKHKRVKLLV